ncbi:MAG: hypothetical protein H6581_06740 [Bacteroidia bacterium]|nr:hypothetical protein [Bacteroidia bacterium]
MRQTLLGGMLLFAFQAGMSQIWAGLNGGPALGRTLDGFAMIQPHNQEWLSVTASGGFTFPGPFFLHPFSNDCLKKNHHSGSHFRVGFRNNLMSGRQNPAWGHHQSHFFWGMNLVISKYKEWAENDGCYPGEPMGTISRSQVLAGGAVLAGYAWNLVPFTRDKNLFLDLGVQFGLPIDPQAGFLGKLNYIPGLGYGKSGVTGWGTNFEFIAILRYEVFHGRYAYNKPKKVKH